MAWHMAGMKGSVQQRSEDCHNSLGERLGGLDEGQGRAPAEVELTRLSFIQGGKKRDSVLA